MSDFDKELSEMLHEEETYSDLRELLQPIVLGMPQEMIDQIKTLPRQTLSTIIFRSLVSAERITINRVQREHGITMMPRIEGPNEQPSND